MENAEPIKVARGRPRKPRPLEEEEENDVVEKKGKGRPRIHPIKDPNAPRKKKEVCVWRDNKPLYFKLYYQNRPKVETTCVHCGNKFDSKITLGKHLIRSVLCKKLRESKENNETTELSNLD